MNEEGFFHDGRGRTVGFISAQSINTVELKNNATMGAGKSKRHRKKRISKHVVESQTRKKQEDAEKQLLAATEGDAETTTSATTDNDANESKKSTKNTKTKDPAEAASYLSLWSLDLNSDSTTKNWKFNKNTQSWLLRHMYDFDKVSKSTFGILVDYVCQGGDKTRLRVEEEAKRRARRYKEWEKKQQNEGDTVQDDNDDDVATSPDDEEWNQLDDHDKRKEYKRARKVLDSLKEQ